MQNILTILAQITTYFLYLIGKRKKNMAVVYQHSNKETKEIFYIGIGNQRRPHEKGRRGKFWVDYTSKHCYVVDIIHTDVNWDEAQAIERYLIAFYGRRDLGLGTLVNMTDGGDGLKNPSAETRAKISYAAKNISEETRQKMRVSQRKSIRPKCSEETKLKIKMAQIGRPKSEDMKLRMSVSHTGKILSEQHKANLSKAGKLNVTHNSGRFQRKITNEQIAKILSMSSSSTEVAAQFNVSRRFVSGLRLKAKEKAA